VNRTVHTATDSPCKFYRRAYTISHVALIKTLVMKETETAKPTIIFITGCTGSGKSVLAHRLALALDAEIISIDSMKVYRDMDIGTAKPSPQARKQVKYHLIDVVDPSERFSAAGFVDLAEKAIDDICRRGRLIIGVGGTVLYLKALTEGLFEGPSSQAQVRSELLELAETRGSEFLHRQLREIDPEAAERIHRNDVKRIVRAIEVFKVTGRPISRLQRQFGSLRDDYHMLFIGLAHDRARLNRRINARVKKMIQSGLVEEVERLHSRRPLISEQAGQALGYAEIIQYLEHKCDLQTAIEKIKINTRRFAKSQRTWFRQMRHIDWVEIPEENEPIDLIEPITHKIKTWLKYTSSC